MCPAPPTVTLDLTSWFAKPKPNPLPAPKKRSGNRLNVLHLSDFHLDPSTFLQFLYELALSVDIDLLRQDMSLVLRPIAPQDCAVERITPTF